MKVYNVIYNNGKNTEKKKTREKKSKGSNFLGYKLTLYLNIKDMLDYLAGTGSLGHLVDLSEWLVYFVKGTS